MIPKDDPEDGFLRRWSARKQAARENREVEPEIAEPPVVDGLPDPAATESDAATPELTDADMPPIESLGDESDYSGFLSPGVSEELRRMALRKLFLSPMFNIRDGLDDYDEDFRTFEKLGEILTADMKFRQEMEDARAAEAAADGDTGDQVAADGDSTPAGAQGESPAEADREDATVTAKRDSEVEPESEPDVAADDGTADGEVPV